MQLKGHLFTGIHTTKVFSHLKTGVSLRAGRCANWPAVRMMSSACFEHLEESQLKKFAHVKTSCTFAVTINEAHARK